MTFARVGFGDLSETGVVAVTGSPDLLNPNGWNEGVWVGPAGNLTLAVYSGEVVPGAAGFSFAQFFEVAINSSSDVSVNASYTEGAYLAGEGIWVGPAGNLSLLAMRNHPAPGTAGGTFGNFSLGLFDDLGVNAFWANTSGYGHGVWAGTPGLIDPIAITGDPAPESGGLNYYDIGFPVAGNPDITIFYAATDNPDFSLSQGIWAYGPLGVSLVALAGNAAPGTGGRNFREFMIGAAAGAWDDPDADPVPLDIDIVRVNDAGAIAFNAYIDAVEPNDPLNWIGDEGIWIKDANGLRLVALTGDDAPGTAGLQFYYFRHFGFNATGQIAFSAALMGADPVRDHGIWMGAPGSVSLVVREGDPAPGTAGETFGSLMLGPFMNDSGDIVFLAWLRESRAYGVWGRKAGGDVYLIAREGEAIRVKNGDYRIIESIQTSVDYDGENWFNEAGQLALSVSFTDGTSGIFLASPVDATANVPPIADAGPDQTTNEGTAVTLNGSGSSDPEGTILTFVWSVGGVEVGTGPQFNSASLAAGVHTVTLTVTDRGGASTSDDMILTIYPNLPPVAIAGLDQTVSHVQTINLDGSASSDPEGSALTYVWSLNGSQIATGATATVGPFATGDHVITLTVTDDLGKSGSDSMIVSVVNGAPVANAGPDKTIETLRTVTIDGSASSDPEGEALVYVWKLGGVQVGVNVRTTVGPLDAGVHTITLTVTDGHGASSSDEMTVTVLNRIPIADAGIDQMVNHAQTVALDGTGSTDPEGAMLGYAWSLGGVQIATGPNPVVGPFAVGTHTVALTVTDDHGATATDNTVITVFNEEPVAYAGPDQAVNVKGKTTAVTLDGSASTDPEGGALSYVWTLDGQTVGTGAALQLEVPAGVHIFTLTVTDDHGATVSDSVVVTATKGGKGA